MAEAKRDQNYITTLLAVSNADGVTPVVLWADPTTHRLLVDLPAGSGTVTSVSVTTANGVSGTVATATTTPAITIVLGAITPSSVNISGLTASELVATDASKNLVSLAVATYPSLVELAYVKGVTSAIQTQLNGKQASGSYGLTTSPLSQFAATTSLQLLGVISDETGTGLLVFGTAPTFETSITCTYLTASEILITNASKGIISAPVATYPSLTELTYVKGVTSAIQTQLNAKGVGDMVLASAQTNSGIKTFLDTTMKLRNVANTFDGYFVNTNTADRIYTLQNRAGTLADDTDLALKAPLASPTFTGTVVLPNSQALVTPVLGTPTSVTLTNATGLPAAAILPGTLAVGTYLLAENASIGLDPAGGADGKYTGITVTGTAGATLAFGDSVYLAVATSKWVLTDADALATAGGVMVGMCVLAANDTQSTTILLQGIIRADAKFPALTIGATVYLGETAGAIQVAIPTGADNIIRVLGYALTADEIYYNPSVDWQVTVA